MNKILIFGDTHGRNKWQDVVVEMIDDVDKIVFIGDYVDSFEKTFEEQSLNLKALLAIQKSFPEKIVTLIGNHDYHYVNNAIEQYSGFQSKHYYIYKELLTNLNLKLAYLHDNFLFTHAGVTNTWFNKWNKWTDSTLPIDDQLNDIFKHKPQSLLFEGRDHYGDNITQSPIWVRPMSLDSDKLENYVHVIGHTQQVEPCYYYGLTLSNIFLLDSPDYYCILENNEITHHKF